MHFVWDATNISHVARHDLTPDQVESLWDADDLAFVYDGDRLILEGTITVGTIRVVCVPGSGNPEHLLVITAHRLHPRRRLTSP